jgi:cystathionine gamma-synthase
LVPASNFILGGRHGYSRGEGTPTWEALEEVVGGLEEGKAVAFASGMAAAAAVFDQLPAGAVVVLPTDCYQGVAALAEVGATKGRWTVTRLDIAATADWVAACGTADLVWLESPSNPLLTVADLEVICAAPRKRGAIVAVDNTFATPLNQRPLSFGATLAMQSATKFIGGHSDLLAGVVTTRDEALLSALVTSRALNGATPGTLEAYLATRGARTLAVRLRQAQATAGLLARRLEGHPLVTTVRYPGLPSHPTHEVAARVLDGFGSMISFDLAAVTAGTAPAGTAPAGTAPAGAVPAGADPSDGAAAAFADEVCRRVSLISHATSLGSVESTMERRAAVHGQEHLPPSLLRLSVGIEDAEDLWTDLENAIEGAAAWLDGAR